MTAWKELLHHRDVLVALSTRFELRVSETTPGTDMDTVTYRDEERILTVVFARGEEAYECLIGTTFDGELAGTSDELLPLMLAFGRFCEGSHYDAVRLWQPDRTNCFADHLLEASTPTRGVRHGRSEHVLAFQVGHAAAELVVRDETVILRGTTNEGWVNLCTGREPEAMLRTVDALLGATTERERLSVVRGLADRLAGFEADVLARTSSPSP